MHRSRYIRKRKNDRSGTGRKGNCGISPQKMTVMIAAGGILLMIFLPDISLLSARKAVNLWLFTIVPSMFPFFICIDLLTKNGMHVYAGNLTDGFFRRVFGVPGTAGFVYVSSVLSGYPTGAKILGEMYESRQILRKDVYDILTFCSTSGPLFILGAVGVGMLHSASAGGVILAAHYAGSLLTGLILIRRSLLRRGISRLTRGRKMENSRTNMEKESGMPEQKT